MKWPFIFILFVSIQLFAQTQSVKIHGVSIQTTKQSASILKRLLGENPPKDWKTYHECSMVSSQAHCYLSRVLNNEQTASLLLELAYKYDLYFVLDQSKTRSSKKMVYDYSSYQSYVDFPPYDLEAIWSLEQLTVVKEVMDKLPTKLTTFDHIKNVYLIPEGYFLTRGRQIPTKRPSTVAVTSPASLLEGKLRREGFIAFFPFPYFRFGNNHETRMTLVHELAHAFDHQLENRTGKMISKQNKWWTISWQQQDHVYYPISNKLFVSKYAMTSPTEDFAESVASFFYEPEKLKKISIEKYEFIKELLE